MPARAKHCQFSAPFCHHFHKRAHLPATFAHPAAILPLLRYPFVPAALVAGAVAPDFPYFMRIPVAAEDWYEPFVNATYTHSLAGMITATAPIALLIFLLLRFLKRPLKYLAGRSEHGTSEMRPLTHHVLWTLVSVLLGILTHVVWDSFTHGDSWLVSRIQVLQAPMIFDIPVNRFLQHASSILGVFFLAFWGARRLKSAERSSSKMRVAPKTLMTRILIASSIVLVSIALSVRSIAQTLTGESSLEWASVITVFVKSGISSASVLLVIYAVIWHAVRLALKIMNRAKVQTALE